MDYPLMGLHDFQKQTVGIRNLTDVGRYLICNTLIHRHRPFTEIFKKGCIKICIKKKNKNEMLTVNSIMVSSRQVVNTWRVV